jgi:Spy/CpxP family protein refolding chaperone
MLKLRRLTHPSLALAVVGLLALPLGASARPTVPRAPEAPTAPAAPTPPGVPGVPAPAMAPEAPEAPAPPTAPTWADEAVWFGDVDEASLPDAGLLELLADGSGGTGDVDSPPPPPDLMAMGLPDEAPALMAMRVGGPGGMGMRGMGPGGPELMSELKLSDSQKQRLADLRDQRRRNAIEARADLQIAALDLGKLMREDRPNRSAIDEQIDKIAQRRAALRKAEVASMLDMREVLTTQQRDVLKQKREEMRERRMNVIRDRVRTRDGARRDVIRTRRPGAGMDSQ